MTHKINYRIFLVIITSNGCTKFARKINALWKSCLLQKWLWFRIGSLLVLRNVRKISNWGTLFGRRKYKIRIRDSFEPYVEFHHRFLSPGTTRTLSLSSIGYADLFIFIKFFVFSPYLYILTTFISMLNNSCVVSWVLSK